MSDTDNRTFRMADDDYALLTEVADREGRSRTKQIIWMVEQRLRELSRQETTHESHHRL